MNLDVITAIVEIVGAGAVVVSLVYLGHQVRAGARAERAATELEASKLWSEFHARVAHSPDMTRIWDTAHSDPASLTDEERQRFVWLVTEYFYLVEGLFKQRSRGILTEDSWRVHANAAAGLLTNPVASEWWASGVSPFSAPFAAHMDALRTRGVKGVWEYAPPAELAGGEADDLGPEATGGAGARLTVVDNDRERRVTPGDS